MSKILFFTACDKNHSQFLLPYIYFAAANHLNSCFEIITDKYNDNNTLAGCEYLSSIFDCKIVLRPIKYDIPCMYLRFLEIPHLRADYCYIGDIDILMFENILNFHINKISEYGTIIDNQIRLSETNRFTGLHFAKYEYFNLVKNEQQKYLNMSRSELLALNDERILLDICKNSGLKIPPISLNEEQFNKNRPIHGLHFSLNRQPFKADACMKFSFNNQSKEWLLSCLNDIRFIGLIKYLNPTFIKNFQKIVEFMKK